MATYTINYLAGETDTVTADRIDSDEHPVDYTFSNNGQVVAVVPIANVRSILRQTEEATH